MRGGELALRQAHQALEVLARVDARPRSVTWIWRWSLTCTASAWVTANSSSAGTRVLFSPLLSSPSGSPSQCRVRICSVPCLRRMSRISKAVAIAADPDDRDRLAVERGRQDLLQLLARLDVRGADRAREGHQLVLVVDHVQRTHVDLEVHLEVLTVNSNGLVPLAHAVQAIALDRDQVLRVRREARSPAAA